MQKPKTKSYPLVTFAVDNIGLVQTPAATGAQSLVLDGALAVGGVLPQQSLAYIIGITCAGDETGRTFTIIGTDADGKAQTEAAFAGVNAGVAKSTLFYRSVTSIVVDDDTAGTLKVGTVATTLVAQSPTYCLDIYQPHTSVAVNIGGTINFSVLKCFQRPTAGETLNFVAGGISAQAADTDTAYTAPTGGVRLQVNSYSAGATASVSFAQSRIT